MPFLFSLYIIFVFLGFISCGGEFFVRECFVLRLTKRLLLLPSTPTTILDYWRHSRNRIDFSARPFAFQSFTGTVSRFSPRPRTLSMRRATKDEGKMRNRMIQWYACKYDRQTIVLMCHEMLLRFGGPANALWYVLCMVRACVY